MAEYQYQTVDVFTTTRFGGNPLAVVPDARGLSTEQMATIAREFNYSESTFVLPPVDPANTANVRIFTPTSEVPFAGHPNVGTSFVLAQIGKVFGKPVGDVMRFEELAGIVEVQVNRVNGKVASTTITAPGRLTVEPIPADVAIAECAGLTLSDLVTSNHPPVMAGVGLTFAVIEVTDTDALARAKPDLAAFEAADRVLPGLPGGVALFVYALVSSDPLVVQARMFAPLDGVLEDPATGSASAALGGLLAELRSETDIELPVTVRQGFEMGRPSIIELNVTKQAGEVVRVDVSGSSVPVMAGTLTI